MSSIIIRTPGYWPLPKFVKLHDGKKWMKLKANKLEEKEGEYETPSAIPPISPSSILILETSITKALPKKIHLYLGKRRFVLSRWIGGLYSNLKSSSSQTKVRAFYDAIAPLYTYHVEPGRANQLAVFLDFIPPHAKVLDASAGDCTFAKAASKTRPDLEVWCSDISKGMLGLGKNIVPTSHLVISSASRLPFPAHSFDALLHSFSNLHPSDRKFFLSFARVLKKNGLLLYHPVKAPGEQWPKDMEKKTKKALLGAGFLSVEKTTAHSAGPKHSTLVFYRAHK